MAGYDRFRHPRGHSGRFSTAKASANPPGTLRRWQIAATGIAAAVNHNTGIAFLPSCQRERERTLQLADISPAPETRRRSRAPTGAVTTSTDRPTDPRRGTHQPRHRRRGEVQRPQCPEQAEEVLLYNSCVAREPNASSPSKTALRHGSTPTRYLRYPVKFAAGERRVMELSAKDFFDVTHNPSVRSSSRPSKTTMTVRGTNSTSATPCLRRRGMANTTACWKRGWLSSRRNRSGTVTRAGHAVPDAAQPMRSRCARWSQPPPPHGPRTRSRLTPIWRGSSYIAAGTGWRCRSSVDPAQYALTGKITREGSRWRTGDQTCWRPSPIWSW